uniref:Uncharacterized protein n=1 Tax=Mycena chlorophos TaxID=658473 RepID=A0ABQ0KTZ7_MYCCL|nr:predicted protein [Mycena chlorophos]
MFQGGWSSFRSWVRWNGAEPPAGEYSYVLVILYRNKAQFPSAPFAPRRSPGIASAACYPADIKAARSSHFLHPSLPPAFLLRPSNPPSVGTDLVVVVTQSRLLGPGFSSSAPLGRVGALAVYKSPSSVVTTFSDTAPAHLRDPRIRIRACLRALQRTNSRSSASAQFPYKRVSRSSSTLQADQPLILLLKDLSARPPVGVGASLEHGVARPNAGCGTTNVAAGMCGVDRIRQDWPLNSPTLLLTSKSRRLARFSASAVRHEYDEVDATWTVKTWSALIGVVLGLWEMLGGENEASRRCCSARIGRRIPAGLVVDLADGGVVGPRAVVVEQQYVARRGLDGCWEGSSSLGYWNCESVEGSSLSGRIAVGWVGHDGAGAARDRPCSRPSSCRGGRWHYTTSRRSVPNSEIRAVDAWVAGARAGFGEQNETDGGSSWERVRVVAGAVGGGWPSNRLPRGYRFGDIRPVVEGYEDAARRELGQTGRAEFGRWKALRKRIRSAPRVWRSAGRIGHGRRVW